MRIIICLMVSLIFPGILIAQELMDSALSRVNAVSQQYQMRLDTTIKKIQKLPSEYFTSGKRSFAKFQEKKQSISSKGDSVLENVAHIPLKYYKKVDSKIEKYSDRIIGKTEKTLKKLSRWEDKIHHLLLKVHPETANKLFAPGQPTFASLLKKLKDGQELVENYKSKYYDEYQDKLTTSLKYIQTQKDNLDAKYLKPVANANAKIEKLEKDISNTEIVEKFIKDRKKQLMDAAVKYIGKSKYLTKINKESYYYIETIRNYKEIFSDPQKAEQTALSILNKIPAFKKFTKENSMLASLFGNSSNSANAQSIAGLQTRASVNTLIHDRTASGGPNVKETISQNMQQAQAELTKLKDKLSKAGAGNSNQEVPDFKPNTQKSRTFLQRIEYGFNYQFGKSNSLMPTTADIGINVGYKLNDKSIIGIGAAYKMGLGTIEKIHVSHQGIGLRSYIDWKLKKQFFVTGGFEMNHNSGFESITQLRTYQEWQSSGLLGISKKLSIKTKLTKGTKIQLLYDVFCRRHTPVSQPFIFRIGYFF